MIESDGVEKLFYIRLVRAGRSDMGTLETETCGQ